MARFADTLRSATLRLWRTDAPLAATGVVMAGLLPLFAAGLWLDPRTIAGAPAWLKPAKFAVSIGIYTFTMAWVFTYLDAWPKTRRLVGRISAAVFAVEMAIIALQAARGTTSHFNVATPLDGVLFTIMGAGILLQTVASVAVLVALWRQPFADAAMGWALRLGLLITILAAFSGGLMTQPTRAQLAEAEATGRLVVAGAHTVGAPDGGPGLPGTGWSTTHGDLRVAHFLGLHALQALPLLLIGLGRLSPVRRTQARPIVVAALGYAALFTLALWQALRGQSLVEPDATTITAVVIWLLATAAGLWWVSGRPAPARASARVTAVRP